MAPPPMTAASGSSSGGAGGITSTAAGSSKEKSVTMQRISACLAELQGALGVVEQYTEGGSGPQGITPHEKFAATKLVYHALCRLNALLDGASKEELLPLEGPLVQGTTAVLQAKRLALTPPFRRALTECFALLLQRSTTLGIFTLAKDMQAILLTPSKAGLPPLARVAALEILTRALQVKARQLSPGLASEAQAAVFKNWKSATTPNSTLCGQCSPADLVALKCAALHALAATMGITGKLETFKAIKTAASDKAPEVRLAAAMALMSVLRPERAEDDFRAVSLDAYLTLGLKGVADDAPASSASSAPNVQLQWAEALAHILAVSVAGQATRAKARGIRAARGGAEAEQESDLPAEGAKSGGSKGRPPDIGVGGDDALGGSAGAGGLPPPPPGPGTPGKKGLASMSAKLKSLTAAAALAARGSRPNSPAPGQGPSSDSGATGGSSSSSSSGSSGSGGLGGSSSGAAGGAPFFLHTFESAVQYLIALFLKAGSANAGTTGSGSAASVHPGSAASASSFGTGPLHRAGIAAALVAFLRRHRAHLAREDTLQWLLGVLLSAVARPGRAQAALKEDLGARAGVAHVLHAGLCLGAPEQVQLSLAAGLGRLLLDSTALPSSLSPLQLQLALGQLTLVLPTLGEGAGPALLPLRSSSLAAASASDNSSSLLSLPHLPRRLLALCRHGSYGVRVEAAVALAALVRALPHTASAALAATASTVRLEYEALEGLMLDAPEDGGEGDSSSSSSSSDEEDEDEEEGEEEEGGDGKGSSSGGAGAGGGGSGSRAPSPTPDGTAAKARRARRGRVTRKGGVEAERRRRICALHGCGAALVLLLKGAGGLDAAPVPPALLEDVMATAKQLVNQAFGPHARRWATGVRTGWAIFGALLHQGASGSGAGTVVGGVSLRPFFHLMARCVELERQHHHTPHYQRQHHHHLVSIGSERDLPLSAAAAAAMDGPSHLLEAMLGALLVLVRENPEALQRAPGALTATVELLDNTLQHLHVNTRTQTPPARSASPPPPIPGRGASGGSGGAGGGEGIGTRTALIQATVMEAFAFLPAGAYPPASAARLFDWALGQMMGLLSALAEGTEGREVVESSLLSDFLRDREEEDAPPLETRSVPRGAFTASPSCSPMAALEGALAGGPAREDLLALWVQTRGVALEDREREAAIATGTMGSPSWQTEKGGLRPPPPHPSARVRLLDAATCLLATTFPIQSPERRAEAVTRLLGLLPPHLRAIEYLSPAASAAVSDGNGNGGSGGGGATAAGVSSSAAGAAGGVAPASSLSSILPSAAAAAAVEEGRRRRREAMQGALTRNVAAALLALIQASGSVSDDGHDPAAVPSWVMRLRDGLFGLLGSPAPSTRRAACEGLALLAHHAMLPSPSSVSSSGSSGGSGLLEHTVSCLVEVAMRGAADAAAASGAGGTGSAATSGLASLMPKSAASAAAAAAAGAAADLQACRAAGAAVALAALRRALGPSHVRLQPCWAAVQCLMVADTPQPLRTWALHALGLLVKGMSLGAVAAGGGHGQDALQTLDTLLEMMEAHFLAPWATPPVQASDNEPALLVALARLFTALLPAVLELTPSLEAGVDADGAGGGGSVLLRKCQAMWRTLAAYPDDRVALECCHALELLALFRPQDPWLASPRTVDFLRLVLQGGHARRRLACALDPFLRSDYEHPVAVAPTSVDAHLLSPAACAAALSCLRALTKRHAPVLRRQRMEATLLAAFDAAASAQGTDIALCAASLPQWRAVANLPRRLLCCQPGAAKAAPAALAPGSFPALLEDIRATLDVLMGGEGGRPLHYLLFARAILLGAPAAATSAAGPPAMGADGKEEGEGGVEGSGLPLSLLAAGGEGDMAMEAALAERLRAKAADAARGLPAARWQAKALVLHAALDALATLEQELQGLLSSSSHSLLYVEARRLIRAFYQGQTQQTASEQQQQQQQPGHSPRPSSPPPTTNTTSILALRALEASPLLLAPLMPDILALGCHAAAGAGAQGGQQQAPSGLDAQAEEGEGEGENGAAAAAAAAAAAVPGLQLKGVQILAALVRLFACVPDPDAPPEEAAGQPPLVLAQYSSQFTTALAPVLQSPLSPDLVEAGCGLFFAGLRAGLLDDAIVLKRLLGRLLPSPLPSSPSSLLAPYQPTTTDEDGTTITSLCTRAVRRQAVATAFVLAMRVEEEGAGAGGSILAAAREGLRRFFLADGGKKKAPRGGSQQQQQQSLLPRLLPDWIGALADALRFQQGREPWPVLPGLGRRHPGGCTYGEGVDAQRLAPCYVKGWPVLLAAASLALIATTTAAVDEEEEQERRRAFGFLLAATEAALQQDGAAALGEGADLRLTPMACVVEAAGALLTSALAVAAIPTEGRIEEGEDEEVDDAEVAAAHAGEEERATAPFRLTPSRLEPLLRALATLAAPSSEVQTPAVGVLRRLLDGAAGVSSSLVGRLLEAEGAGDGAAVPAPLWEAVEEAALLPATCHLPALLPSGGQQHAPSATASAPLLAALSLPAALPPLCPQVRRVEALPRLLAFGLRALTLGVESHGQDPALDAALVDAGYAVVRAVWAVEALLSAAQAAAALGEAVVTVVGKGLGSSATSTMEAGRLGWEGWLAALPPPEQEAVSSPVEGAIEAGLAWVASAVSGNDDLSFGDEEEQEAFAPPLAAPLGTRARRVLLAGARAAAQARGPRASQLLRHFGPAAVQALSAAAAAADEPQPPQQQQEAPNAGGNDDDDWGFDDAPASIVPMAAAPQEDEEEEHLLAEATKLLLLGFTSLAPSSSSDLPTLQARHLALSLPLLSRILRHRYVTTTLTLGPARTATRQLLSQALLAVARAAPGPFKEGVQQLPPEDKAALEGALRAAVAGPGGAGAGSAGGSNKATAPTASAAAPPLKIDMSRYA